MVISRIIYIMENSQTKRPWFKARSYGWGWTPCSVAGWIVTAATAVLLVGGDLLVVMIARDPEMTHRRSMLIAVVLAWNTLIAGAAVVVCWMTGELPRWRWGKSE